MLELVGMPNAAQFLPNEDELHKDKGVDLNIFECTQCGLVQTSQEPVPYYKEVIRASAFSGEMAAFRQKQLKVPKKSKNGSRPRHLDLRRQPGHRPEPGFRFRIRISDQAGSSLRSQSSGRAGPLHLRRPDFAISSTTFSSYKSKSPVLLRCGLLGI